MLPFKTRRTLDHFAVIQPPTNAKYIFFQGGLLHFLPVCINVKLRTRKLLLSKARNKMYLHFIMIKEDQFRGIFFFFFKFSIFCLHFQLTLSPFSFVCYRCLFGKVLVRLGRPRRLFTRSNLISFRWIWLEFKLIQYFLPVLVTCSPVPDPGLRE